MGASCQSGGGERRFHFVKRDCPEKRRYASERRVTDVSVFVISRGMPRDKIILDCDQFGNVLDMEKYCCSIFSKGRLNVRSACKYWPLLFKWGLYFITGFQKSLYLQRLMLNCVTDDDMINL